MEVAVNGFDFPSSGDPNSENSFPSEVSFEEGEKLIVKADF